MFKNIPPKISTLSAIAIGYILLEDTTEEEQNALGNWLMLIAQILCTNAYFVQLNTQNTQDDTINIMQKMVNALSQEIENLKRH